MCNRCGALVAWFNDLFGEQPEDCGRCHRNGRLLQGGCRSKGCARCKSIDSGWSDKGWPR